MNGAEAGEALHAEWLTGDHTAATGRPVVLLHGFTQTTRCWGPFGNDVSGRHRTLAVDAPGHGGSAHLHADLPRSAALLAETIEAVVDGAVTVIGYSMGGRLALHLGLLRPDLVANLVLIGATAGIDDDVDRAARRAMDDGLADHVLALGVEDFIDEWLAKPMFAGLTPEAACRDERLTNTADGLASSLRLAGTGTQQPLWEQLGALTMPVLVIAGETDTKFRAIGTRLAERIGATARVEIIDGAGHAAHLERPTATAATIERWLSTLP